MSIRKFIERHIPAEVLKGWDTLVDGWIFLCLFMLGAAIQGLPLWIVIYLATRWFQ